MNSFWRTIHEEVNIKETRIIGDLTYTCYDSDHLKYIWFLNLPSFIISVSVFPVIYLI